VELFANGASIGWLGATFDHWCVVTAPMLRSRSRSTCTTTSGFTALTVAFR
jgi:hypothetical protein